MSRPGHLVTSVLRHQSVRLAGINTGSDSQGDTSSRIIALTTSLSLSSSSSTIHSWGQNLPTSHSLRGRQWELVVVLGLDALPFACHPLTGIMYGAPSTIWETGSVRWFVIWSSKESSSPLLHAPPPSSTNPYGGEPVAGLLRGKFLHWLPTWLLAIGFCCCCTLADDVAAFSLNPVEDKSTRINTPPSVAVENSLLNYPVAKNFRSYGFVAFM